MVNTPRRRAAISRKARDRLVLQALGTSSLPLIGCVQSPRRDKYHCAARLNMWRFGQARKDEVCRGEAQSYAILQRGLAACDDCRGGCVCRTTDSAALALATCPSSIAS